LGGLIKGKPAWCAGDPKPSTRFEEGDVVRDLASLPLSADGLEGRFSVWLIAEASEHQGILYYEAWSANRIARGVYFQPGGVKDDEQAPMIVQERIRVVRHPAWRSVPAWTEIRIEDAEQILPREALADE